VEIKQRIKTTGKGKSYKVGLLDTQACRLVEKLIESLPEDQEYLFMVNGGHVATSTSNKHFTTCVKRAGIPLEGRSQYSLRHTFMTSVAGEIDERHVKELMGHTKFRDDYDHRVVERRLKQLQEVRKVIEGIV
jgi:integrase